MKMKMKKPMFILAVALFLSLGSSTVSAEGLKNLNIESSKTCSSCDTLKKTKCESCVKDKKTCESCVKNKKTCESCVKKASDKAIKSDAEK